MARKGGKWNLVEKSMTSMLSYGVLVESCVDRGTCVTMVMSNFGIETSHPLVRVLLAQAVVFMCLPGTIRETGNTEDVFSANAI